MADKGITVTSRDLEAVIKLHRKYPELINKTFPATAREETKSFRRNLKTAIISNGWPRNFIFKGQKAHKPIDLASVSTKLLTRNTREKGVRIMPKHPGPSALFEFGSKGVRRKKTGSSTGVFPAKPVYANQWSLWKGVGKNTIQQSLIKSTIRQIDRLMKKRGI